MLKTVFFKEKDQLELENRVNAFIKNIKKLFCKHDYKKLAWREKYDQVYNERYSERLYNCSKCGKRIWVDGRYDPYFGK